MKKILIIDDKNENFISCKAILEDNFRKCYIFKALSGKEGIKIAINDQPDVILLDIVMPEMDGYQTCKTLKKDKRTNHIPIILISAAKTDSKSRVKGLIGGADAFLSKPIDTDEFVAQIKVMLRIKEAEDKLRGEKLRFEKLVEEKTVELRDSSEKYKALYENAPLPYQSLNEYGSFNDINPAWLDSMGYERHEVIGKAYKDFLHPDHQEQFEKNFPEFKKHGYVNDVECKIRHKKGHYLDILLEGCIGYNPDGSFKQTHCVLQDITQKKLLEEELLLKTIVFDSSVSGNSISNKNGILTNVNTAFLNFLGYETSDEVIGKSLTKFIKYEHEAENIINFLGNFGVWTGEYVGLKKDGTEFIANANASTLKDAYNNFIGYQFSVVDITEKKEAEENIRWLSQAVEQSPVIIVITDLKGKIEYSNPKFTEITGYTKKEALGKNLKILKTGETAITDYKELWNTIRSGNEWKGIFHNKKKNGELFWESASISPIKNKEGKITHYLGVKEDITARKQVEEKLLQSEVQFRTTFEKASVGMSLTRLDGKLLLVNDAFSEMVGYTKDELMDKWVKDITHPDDVKSNYNFKKKMLSGEMQVLRFGKRYLHKNGSIVWVEVNLALQKETKGKPLYFISHLVNVTERKNAEKLLMESNELNNSVLQTIPFEMNIVDEEGNILFQSEKFRELFGQEAIGNKCWTLYRDDKQQCPCCPLHAGIQIGETLVCEVSGVLGGKTFQIYHTGMLHHGKKALLEIFQDITAKKQAEIELIAAKEKSEESDRLKSAFLANMSHEIRTPMNGILGFAELLKEPDLTGDQQSQYIDLIQKGGARMLNIINDIIDISRIESNLVNLSTSETDINKSIEYIHAFFKLETDQKQIKLDYKAPLPTGEANVIIDREKIYAILTNLVKNAIKFTKKGSIEIGYTKKEDYLIFYVKDTGIGIHKDRQEPIFERFIQADIEGKNAYQGAGLGLSISKAYVEMMNGKLWVESEFGKGSTFYFTIPYIVKVNGKQDDNISITDVDDIIKSLKVLIVEDDKVSMDLLKIIMEESHTLYTASNGAEAVKICKDNSDIDLILMDVRMPIMDGFEATKEIRLFNKDVVIIAQTAYGLAGDRKIAIEAGCNNYVSKPIVKNILFSKIRECFINNTK
jgi:PAS domain S-box-containing protein